jgi:hypothetical protein
LRLISSDEQKDLNVESFFDPLRGIEPFYVNEILNQEWKNAKI